jgi:hypothetical protein
MGVVYDELYISTMREMDVCRKSIKRLSKTLEDLERKYNLTTDIFIQRFRDGSMKDEEDYRVWHSSYAGLKNWEKKLKEFHEILLNAKESGVEDKRGERAQED